MLASNEALYLLDSNGTTDTSTITVDDIDNNLATCLFCSYSNNNIDTVYQHMDSIHSFNYNNIIKSIYNNNDSNNNSNNGSNELDFYNQIKLINYIRTVVKSTAADNSNNTAAAIESIITTINQCKSIELFANEQYLLPVLKDDALLFNIKMNSSDSSDSDNSDSASDADSDSESDSDPDEPNNTIKSKLFNKQQQKQQQKQSNNNNNINTNITATTTATRSVDSLLSENNYLHEQIAELQSAINTMKQTFNRLAFDSNNNTVATATTTTAATTVSSTDTNNTTTNDSNYFTGYSDRLIHEIMLKDNIRTEAYQNFIKFNSENLFRDKVVLDVGCGTGILSLFAAAAGAKLVLAVDASNIIDYTEKIIKRNNYSNIIKCYKGKIESVKLPIDDNTVDIIISEWMGYFLLFESMLPSVLYARDKYLKKPNNSNISNTASNNNNNNNNIGVYPDKSIMYIIALSSNYNNKDTNSNNNTTTTNTSTNTSNTTVSTSSPTTSFWHNVYGFDMSDLINPLDELNSTELNSGCSIDIVPSNTIVSINPIQIKLIDCNSIIDRELDFNQKFTIQLLPDLSTSVVDSFAVYFDSLFELNSTKLINLSTSPLSTPTHWYQTIFKLIKPIIIPIELQSNNTSNNEIIGSIEAQRMKSNNRNYHVTITYQLINTSQNYIGQQYIQKFKIK